MQSRVLHALLLCGTAVWMMFRATDTAPDPRYGYDRPSDQDEYFYRQRAFPADTIPADWYDRARARIDAMRAQGLAKSASWHWMSLGPVNIAGRLRALAMDPVNPDVLYGGAAGGGVWRTTNAGATWTALSDFVPNLRIGSIAVNPFDPAMVLAGNGEGFVAWQGGLAYGRGVYRSADAGQTWILLPSTATQDFAFVFDLAFDPFARGAVMASTARGVFRSTDNGDTWQRTITGGAANRGMMCVFSRTTEGLVYCAFEGLGVFRSLDHGVTWSTSLTAGLQMPAYSRIVIAAAPTDGDIVYAAFTGAADESCVGVFRSADRGDTWSRRAIPMNMFDGNTYMGAQGEYNSVLVVHPTDPETVIAGGIDLYRSTDGGQGWRQVSNWYVGRNLPYVHADQHAVLFDPRDPRRFYAACDGGLFRTPNAGASFEGMNAGLVTTQFHSGAPHPASDLVLGGTIDNGTLRTEDGANWRDVTGGDGGCTAIDPGNPSVMYGELYYLHFLKSTDGGVEGSWRVKLNGIPRSSSYGTSDPVNFIAPFEMDPNDPAVIYAGTNRVYRTSNGAEQWTPASAPIAGPGVLSAIGLAESDSRVVYAGGSMGTLYRTTDGGATWTRGMAGLPTRYVTDIAVNRSDAATAYVTVSGFGSGHLYKTTDHGGNWRDISGAGAAGLPDVPANTIALHPSQPGVLYVGTDVGLFTSSDDGGTWTVNNEGIGNVTIADLRFRADGVLFAATHGRGMYRSNFSLTDPARFSLPGAFALRQNFPNPSSALSRSTAIPYELGATATVSLAVFDATGRRVRTEEMGRRPPGRYNHQFDTGSLPSGVYFYRLIVDGAPSDARRMVVLK